ncbi:hypothetical protein DPMN_020209 [Dreissena polymorpha]|uniref:Uncharacterized protein n=1 Tax=Dreissena polymorpha TaxID=45954 RepID=A0A9D4SA03_DREPO|nr:hypothetical protein DPMN_020209 [Dreissena polymorpha]
MVDHGHMAMVCHGHMAMVYHGHMTMANHVLLNGTTVFDHGHHDHAVHDRGRSLPLSPAEEPSQFIGQNAVTQILTVLETMRDENREMKQMLQRLLARSATDDEPMQLPENITLPIGTFEQMDEFEEHLGDEATIHLF